MKWIRDAFKGALIVKGVQNCEDARRAIDCGASAVVVSNHRARSLRLGSLSVTGTLRSVLHIFSIAHASRRRLRGKTLSRSSI
jgi:isopentenyl diphosphate isomerase/L-lactate dehydrogenase-like FMN-dependent dehydrogenase